MLTETSATNVLLVGKRSIHSSPLITLTAALSRRGYRCRFVDRTTCRMIEWLRLLGQNDAIIFVVSHAPRAGFGRLLALAAARGVPIIRWWVGTDALNCLRNQHDCVVARRLDRLVALNIAVAPHLVKELASVGIHARLIHSVLANTPPNILIPADRALKKAVLVYLPTKRRAFYGAEIVQRCVETNPDLAFVIVADRSHSLAPYANVRSLGWVEDMDDIWPQIGILLRVTEHDGMPRMVLDAILRGKYVIYAWPFPGCWLARDFGTVHARLSDFKQVETINTNGIQAVREMLTPDPANRFSEAIDHAVSQPRSQSRRIAGIRCLAPRQWRR